MVFRQPDPDKTGINDNAEYLCDYITEILHLFWLGELVIDSWHTDTLSPVPKNGDLSDLNKWRP
eukprot:6929828-Ditylum_brightwellii.AAC.1